MVSWQYMGVQLRFGLTNHEQALIISAARGLDATMKQNRRNMVILFFTLVVIMLGFGMIIPLVPFYIDRFGASGSELGLLMATFATMQFFFAPRWGGLSDRRGRKVILKVGDLGHAL